MVTVYQPTEISKKMIHELLSNKEDEEQANHFVRISSSILFLEFIEEHLKTGFTIIKNDGFLSEKSVGTFHPYSTWHHYNFVNM